ncbi:replication factor c, putative [Eimeria maxima]|uniref:Replication factor c, putative n=1 Tax=Eimeria maxima TaxID=5804 RepID=U6MAC2_EIMMA|nr:replication factor c, putative [Eimeria maxima]CDJ59998.1 replication factor c, putative [Eimeria maxima]
MLWVDKHAPRRLDDLDCHPHLTPLFRSLAASDNPPHLLLYGPSGAGKKTRVLAYLREVFGEEIDKVRVETFVEKETNAEATLCQSNDHTIISCAEFGTRDKAIVQGVIKDLVEAAPQASIASSFFFTKKRQKRYKVVVVLEADILSKVVVLQDADILSEGAQHSLRRSLESSVGCLQFILLAANPTAITPPLKSRCLGIRVPLPPTGEVIKVLKKTALKEETPVNPKP